MTTSGYKITSLTAALALVAQVSVGNLLATAAQAADMLGDGDQEYTEVEFGTGWYLRGDIGGGLAEVEADATFVDDTASLGTPLSVSAAIGYTFNEGIRAEVAVNQFNNLAFSSRTDYPDCGLEDHDGDGSPIDVYDIGGTLIETAPIAVTGDCFFSVNARINATTLMGNAYVDLGQYFGFRPYVGAGLGAAYVSWNNFTWTDHCSGNQSTDCGEEGGAGIITRAEGGYTTESSITYAANAMVGLSYELTDNVALDMGYRFTYIGPAGVARAADNSGIKEDWEIGNSTVHEVRMGLRYEIW